MDSLRLSPSAQRVLSTAADESGRFQHHYLGVEHLFLALTKHPGMPLADALAAQGFDAARLVEMLRKRSKTPSPPPWHGELLFTRRCRNVLQLASRIAGRQGADRVKDLHLLEAIFREGRSVPLRLLRSSDVDIAELYEALTPEAAEPPKSPTPIINRYGRDLTHLARSGALMPVIGRQPEMELLAQVLLRKNKNNPVLVGEAGVGKTAVVEGFASLLVADSCPAPLSGRRLVELSVSSLIAGTKFRGEFEERILNVLHEATADPNLILFFDEIHTLVGAGANPGEAMDAANIVKPALARGDLSCIGATTTEEYRRYIEKDTALERRFEPVRVEEPSVSEARHILKGLVSALEDHHQVLISEAAVEAALTLTVRYLPGRRLPDKAIDALDQSCARVRLKSLTVEAKTSVPIPAGAPQVDEESVACTVSQWTGIPLERVSGEQARELLRLEEELRSRVVGQSQAVTAVTRAILTAKAGLADPDRPTGVFLFLGPTGVGKTEMAKSLADLLFGSEKRLIRFDMSEFTEAHSVAKLIGAPPGYVGHEQEGQLISAVRSHPHCVLLFDELEKAHAQIFDLFLQIFDEGRLRGAHGELADFTNAVVILTSNLDPRPERRTAVGFGEEGVTQQAAIDPRALLARFFRPELVNRIDEIVVFNRLGKPELQQIIDRFVRGIEQLAAARELRLELDEAVYEWLIDLGVSEMFGARELRRAVDRHLRQPLAEELLRRGEGASTIRIRVEDGKLRLD